MAANTKNAMTGESVVANAVSGNATIREQAQRIAELEAKIVERQRAKLAELERVLADVEEVRVTAPERLTRTVPEPEPEPATTKPTKQHASRKLNERGETVSAMARRLVLAGTSDADVDAEIVKAFGPSDRTYSPGAWHRQALQRAGLIPPALAKRLAKVNGK